MTWDEFRIGDVVENYGDLLAVVGMDSTRVYLLALDIVGGMSDTSPGTVEVWDSDDKGWRGVVEDTVLVFRADD